MRRCFAMAVAAGVAILIPVVLKLGMLLTYPLRFGNLNRDGGRERQSV